MLCEANPDRRAPPEEVTPGETADFTSAPTGGDGISAIVAISEGGRGDPQEEQNRPFSGTSFEHDGQRIEASPLEKIGYYISRRRNPAPNLPSGGVNSPHCRIHRKLLDDKNSAL
jgi:hypothetical protein